MSDFEHVHMVINPDPYRQRALKLKADSELDPTCDPIRARNALADCVVTLCDLYDHLRDLFGLEPGTVYRSSALPPLEQPILNLTEAHAVAREMQVGLVTTGHGPVPIYDLTSEGQLEAWAQAGQLIALLAGPEDDMPPPAGAPHRELDCGCWQAFLHGDIVTSATEQWVTFRACARHKVDTP